MLALHMSEDRQKVLPAINNLSAETRERRVPSPMILSDAAE
jgi:hypothetical protein